MAKSFWSYDAPPTPDVPEWFNGTREQWEQLTPGYRREIVRTHEKMKQKEDSQ